MQLYLESKVHTGFRLVLNLCTTRAITPVVFLGEKEEAHSISQKLENRVLLELWAL
jgi:hypothetical protein